MSSERESPALDFSKEDRQRWLRRLSNWQTPASMSEKVEELRALLGSEVLTRARAGFFRDAWAAARFAALRKARQVRLAWPEPRPDFELRWGEEFEAFELVEADWPHRRRGDELRRSAAVGAPVEAFPEEAWLTPEAARQMLQRASGRKALGGYLASCRLLIYLNGSEFDTRREEIEQQMRPATAEAGGAFDQVWVMWNGRLYQPW
jgi:hypothetical protein